VIVSDECEDCGLARCICAPSGLIPGTLVWGAWRSPGQGGREAEPAPLVVEDAAEKIEWLNRFYSGKVHHFLTIRPLHDAQVDQ